MTVSAYLRSLVRIGVSEKEQSLTAIKSIVMLTRLCLFSGLLISLTIFVSLLFGLYENALRLLTALPFFVYNYYLIYRRRIGAAKLFYSALILSIVSFFSIAFGDGTGVEYWFVIMGVVSMLIFKRRDNSFNFVVICALIFLGVEFGQEHITPIMLVRDDVKPILLSMNLIMIISTSFMFSFILRYSSEDFEQRVDEKNAVLLKKNRDLTDSINYAYRIQSAVLPSEQLKRDYSMYLFVMFEPRDIVSGDFYWIYPLQDRILFAVVDGAGHGVPGALISMLSHTMLTESVEEFGLREPGDIVIKLRELILERKVKWNDELSDNMKITIISFEWLSQRLTYSSNGNHIYLIKHVNNIDAADDMKADENDRYAMKEIRKKHSLVNSTVSESEFMHGSHYFRKDDVLYLLTDGMSRQLGGPNYKKLKSKRMRDLLMSVQHFSLEKQQHIIGDVFHNWKGRQAGTDDITLIGFKI